MPAGSEPPHAGPGLPHTWRPFGVRLVGVVAGVGLLAVCVLWLSPAVWVLVTSLKRTQDIVRVPPEWIPWPVTFAHYGEVFWSARTASIGRAFLKYWPLNTLGIIQTPSYPGVPSAS